MSHMMILDDGRCGTGEDLAGPLRGERHRVTCAHSAHEAVSHLGNAPDLIIIPVKMLGRDAAPLVGALSERIGDPLPAVAFYWNQVEHGAAGGPTPFGSCWYVARAGDWTETHQRLVACLGARSTPLHLPREPIARDNSIKYVA